MVHGFDQRKGVEKGEDKGSNAKDEVNDWRSTAQGSFIWKFAGLNPSVTTSTMASGNPTLDAAEASTGIEPLNAQPTLPQPPNPTTPSTSQIPTSLSSLPSGYDPLILPLDLGSRTSSSQSISSLPSANAFEDLLHAKVRPPGPARAEDVGLDVVENRFAEVVERVRGEVDSGQVKVYKVEAGVGKTEYYIAGLDLGAERIVAVRTVG
ncbi:MAG: hypothetical protein Q9165_001317 [Trypethelium subeluteriae]